jgi:hypothetical protein
MQRANPSSTSELREPTPTGSPGRFCRRSQGVLLGGFGFWGLRQPVILANLTKLACWMQWRGNQARTCPLAPFVRRNLDRFGLGNRLSPFVDPAQASRVVGRRSGVAAAQGFLRPFRVQIHGLGIGSCPGILGSGSPDGVVRQRLYGSLDRSLPIRFLPTPPRCRVLPGTGVKLRIGRCGNAARDAE